MTIFASQFDQFKSKFKSKFGDLTDSELSNRVPSTRRNADQQRKQEWLLQTALVVAVVCLRKIARWCQIIVLSSLIYI